MSSDNAINQILFIVLAVMISILVILILVFLILKGKSNREKNAKPKDTINGKKSGTNKGKESNQIEASSAYNKQSIYDFMDFDKVEDNMIIQKGGKRYIMVIECQGVNYDLMSKVEKVSVEEGFQQFLNTLRHPIQIYIQTRTINLESSIAKYRQSVKQIEDKYRRMSSDYKRMVDSGQYTKEQLERQFFELTKQKNMLEYSRDLIDNTEKMSLNRSVLNKKYYIIIPYYPEEANSGQYDIEELKSMAFSELYTKSQAIIRTLSSCSVSGKILSSKELIELLYVAYNRDDSEIYGIDKAMRAGYEDLYSTSEDIFEKKMRILDEEIEDRAIDLANEKIDKIKSKTQREAEEKENNIEELISRMAELILEENKDYVGRDVAEEAIDEIKKERKEKTEEEVSEDEKVKKTTRGRKKKTV